MKPFPSDNRTLRFAALLAGLCVMPCLAVAQDQLDPPVARYRLPKALTEISGLAMNADGRLFAHDDERGIIFEVDYRSGRILKSFSLGRRGLRGDYEGIAVVGESIWLVTSDGNLYETAEGRDGARVNYTRHRTGVDCEVEGLAYDPSLDALLLACKHVGRRQRGKLIVYRWALRGDGDSRLTTLTVPLADLLRQTGWREFHPSGIEVDPVTGDYVIISSLDHALIEITPDGRRVRAMTLPADRHRQPEGVTFTPDGMLLISDEARGRTPWLTVYRWR